jgi:hypothetical protein
MPDKSPTHLPKYRHYKPKNLAVARLDGRDVYLGHYDSDKSREKYRRVLAEWLAGKPTQVKASTTGPQMAITVSEVVLAFIRNAESHYRSPSGAPKLELQNVKDAIRPVRKLYGRTSALEFGPLN